MSTSTKSKPESESSPAPGSGKDVSVELEVVRQRAAGWAAFGIVVGILCILKLGTVGVWAGIVLIIVGVYRGYQLAMTFLHQPGTIVVGDTDVTLPRGLCVGNPIRVKKSEVTAVYLLRRSVPFHRAAPVLVVELGAKAMIYPRDWFATEADQREVVGALVRDRLEAPAASEPTSPSE